MDFEKLMAIILIGGVTVILSFLALGDLVKSSPKYDSYNKAMLNCSLNKTENERNNCRVQVTKFYMKNTESTQK